LQPCLLPKLTDGGLFCRAMVERVFGATGHKDDGVACEFLILVALVDVQLEGPLTTADGENHATVLATSGTVDEVMEHGGNTPLFRGTAEGREHDRSELATSIALGAVLLERALGTKPSTQRKKRETARFASFIALGGCVLLRQELADESVSGRSLWGTDQEEAPSDDASKAGLSPELLNDVNESARSYLEQPLSNCLELERGVLKASLVKEAELQRHASEVRASGAVEMW
jgi:hypothetical protein